MGQIINFRAVGGITTAGRGAGPGPPAGSSGTGIQEPEVITILTQLAILSIYSINTCLANRRLLLSFHVIRKLYTIHVYAVNHEYLFFQFRDYIRFIRYKRGCVSFGYLLRTLTLAGC